MDGRWRLWTAVASAARHRFGDRSAGASSKPKRRRRCARPCSLHGSLATGVAKRLDDGSRGLQPTVARGENPRRGATLERPHLPTIQASLRDADPLGPPPWAEAHGYSRSSLRDETETALPDSCKEQALPAHSKICAMSPVHCPNTQSQKLSRLTMNLGAGLEGTGALNEQSGSAEVRCRADRTA